MKTLEAAAKAELAALPPEIGDGTLAQAVLDLARRLDTGPADSIAVLLVRELRIALTDLRVQAKSTGGGEVDAFLAGLSAEAFNTGH